MNKVANLPPGIGKYLDFGKVSNLMVADLDRISGACGTSHQLVVSLYFPNILDHPIDSHSLHSPDYH